MRRSPEAPTAADRPRARLAWAAGLALLAVVGGAAPSGGQTLDVWFWGNLWSAEPVEHLLFLAPHDPSAATAYLDSVGLTELDYVEASCLDFMSIFQRPVASGTPAFAPVSEIVETYGEQVSNSFFWAPALSIWGFEEDLFIPTPFLKVRFVETTSSAQAQSILYGLDIGRVIEEHSDRSLLVQSFSRSGLEVIQQVNQLALRADVEMVSLEWLSYVCGGPSGEPPGGGFPPFGVPPQIPTAQPIGLLALVLGLAALGAARLRSRRA